MVCGALHNRQQCTYQQFLRTKNIANYHILQINQPTQISLKYELVRNGFNNNNCFLKCQQLYTSRLVRVQLVLDSVLLTYFRICQSIVLNRLVNCYSLPQETFSKNQAYVYSSLMILTTYLVTFAYHNVTFRMSDLSIKIQVACRCLIYRKSLKLTQNKVTAGHVVNLVTNDVNNFGRNVYYAHYLWLAPLETVIILYLVYSVLGSTATIGMMIILICMILLSKKKLPKT